MNFDNYEEAKKIADYNNRLLESHLRKKAYTTDKQLWVPYHMWKCREETLRNTNYPIFGKGFEKVLGRKVSLEEMGKKAKQTIKEHYSVESNTKSYLSLFDKTAI